MLVLGNRWSAKSQRKMRLKFLNRAFFRKVSSEHALLTVFTRLRHEGDLEKLVPILCRDGGTISKLANSVFHFLHAKWVVPLMHDVRRWKWRFDTYVNVSTLYHLPSITSVMILTHL